MTTETNAQDEAKKIWDQLEAEDNGESRSEPVEETTETEATAPAAAETSTQDAPAEDEDDPKVLRNKLAGMEVIINQLSGRLRNAEGHIGGLNSQVKLQIEAARKAEAAGASAPTAVEIQAAQGSATALAELERDYPEFAKALRPAIEATFAQRMAEFEKRIPQPQAQPVTDVMTKQEMEVFKAELRVESKHPGWQEKVAKPEFAGWLETAPRELRMLAGSNDPSDAIRLLDVFEESRNSGKQTSQRHQAAAALPTGNRSAVRTKNVDDMTPQEYWRYLDQQDRQKA